MRLEVNWEKARVPGGHGYAVRGKPHTERGTKRAGPWGGGGVREQEGPCPWQPQRSDGPGVSRTGSEGGREKPGGPWGTAPGTLHPCRAQEGRCSVAGDLRLSGVRGTQPEPGRKARRRGGRGLSRNSDEAPTASGLREERGGGGSGSSGKPAPEGACGQRAALGPGERGRSRVRGMDKAGMAETGWPRSHRSTGGRGP